MDETDLKLLAALQAAPDLSQRELAERINLSQNACWRRLKKLEDSGVIVGRSLRLDREALGLDLIVFAMIRTRSHSAEWLEKFRRHVATIPEVIDFYRISGDYDYMLKIAARDMANYDRVYQRLIEKIELDNVTSYFAMEAIFDNRPLPLR
ncbi:Lrp/AsnC family transcriptional regulator [Amorphus sp. 3PC139-8]|uniref:Lrp/AsnC family transcriptional regulator n=1 Tax=Amorphus sp. 3PC139-8 TaxID=2735676 RepID=UPI00345CB5CC